MTRKVITYILLIAAVLVSLFPFYFMFVSATNSNAEILSSTPLLTFGDRLFHNITQLDKKINILRILKNSLFITVTYTVLAVFLHSMAGYALVKYDFKGKHIFFAMIMLTMMIPAQVLYIPLFTLMNNIGMTNTHAAVILPALANAFGIFLMRQNMMNFPTSIIEAARIDGSSEIKTFFMVVLPNMKPALGALSIYMFMAMWNSFMWPLIVLSTKNKYNFPVALATLDGNTWQKDYGVTMLAAAISVIPIMIMFIIGQKQFISGLMGGAVKE